MRTEMKVPEILGQFGWDVKQESKAMFKAHNEMMLLKAGVFEGNRPTGEIRTVKDGERIAERQSRQLLSSFEDKEYRAAARRFLEKVLPVMKQDIVKYDAEVKEAAAKQREAAAKLKEASLELERCKNKRQYHCGLLGDAVIKPFLYVNDGGGVINKCGYIPQRLYPQLGFMVPSYNFDPVAHVEYILQEIERRDAKETVN